MHFIQLNSIRQIIEIDQSSTFEKQIRKSFSTHTRFVWVKFETETLKQPSSHAADNARIYLFDTLQIPEFIYRQWLIYA